MAEYINRDEILKYLDECKGEPSELCYTYALYRSVEHIVRDIPAADVAEVKRGEWVDGTTGYTCSVCHEQEPTKRFTYCPNCGAKMKG